MVAYRFKNDQSLDIAYIELESRDCSQLQKYESTI
jgi:hypothetical protein